MLEGTLFSDPFRWYEKFSNIPMGEVSIPHLLEREGHDGPQLEVLDKPIPILWPWDLLHWRDSIQFLGCWIADKPDLAGMKCLAPHFEFVIQLCFFRIVFRKVHRVLHHMENCRYIGI